MAWWCGAIPYGAAVHLPYSQFLADSPDAVFETLPAGSLRPDDVAGHARMELLDVDITLGAQNLPIRSAYTEFRYASSAC